MSNKKTAFEQYIEEFDKIMKISNNLSFEARFSALEDLKEKTKAREKEQIIDAFGAGWGFKSDKAEQYYEKKYGGNK